jgi:hypothetical protein
MDAEVLSLFERALLAAEKVGCCETGGDAMRGLAVVVSMLGPLARRVALLINGEWAQEQGRA